MEEIVSYLPLILPILILQLVLAVIGLISLFKAERVLGPKWIWVIIIVCGNIVGSILYFIIGRKET